MFPFKKKLSTTSSAKVNLSKLFAYLSVLIVGLAVFVSGYYIGNARGISNQAIDLSQYWRVYNVLKDKYVGNIDTKKLKDGSISGLVSGLGDSYTVYLPPTQRKALDDDLKGEFEGIGAELTDKDGLVVVVAPISGSPADKAGIKAQDVIVKVDDKSVEKMTVDEVVDLIRGPKDTQVKLTVLHKDASDVTELTITRAVVQIKSVEWKMIDNIGYINVNQFGDDTVSLFESAVKEIAGKSPKAIILDVRNNPGGYLDSVAPVVGKFIPPSVVVYEKDKAGKFEDIRSTEAPLMPTVPLYVLVNGGTASAAEIMAGALQDYKRATLIGTKTFGKGSVQEVVSLGDGSAVKVTIAEWLTPLKRAINKLGIEPDVKVEGEKTLTSDPVLDKALETAKK